jgi:hypothetical protein
MISLIKDILALYGAWMVLVQIWNHFNPNHLINLNMIKDKFVAFISKNKNIGNKNKDKEWE